MSSSSSSLSCLGHVKRVDNDNKRPTAPSNSVSHIVVDVSGSTYTMGSAPKEGLRSWLESQRKMARSGGRHVVEVTIFDTFAKIIFQGQAQELTDDIIEGCCLQVYPKSSTRLYDTACESIRRQQASIQREKSFFSKTEKKLGKDIIGIFTLITDGYDNISVKETAASLKTLVSENREKFNVINQFVAGNIDADITGTSMGFTKQQTMQMATDPESARNAMMAVTSSAERALNAPSSMARQRSEFTSLERAVSSGLRPFQPFSSSSSSSTSSSVPLQSPFLAPTRNWVGPLPPRNILRRQ